MGIYNGAFQCVLENCEEVLGICSFDESKSLELLPIAEFYKRYREVKFTDEELIDVSTKCATYITTLTYISERANFKRISVLEFGAHGRIDLLVELLAPFQKRENISYYVKENIKNILLYLEVLEKNNIRFINSLSYRFIRLFVVFTMIGDYTHAGIIAKFIIEQVFLSEDVDNAVKMKIDELRKANTEMKKIAKSYKANNSIADLVNNEPATINDEMTERKRERPKEKPKVENDDNSKSSSFSSNMNASDNFQREE